MKGKTPDATVAAHLYSTAKKGTTVTTLDGTEGKIVKPDRFVLAFKKGRARAVRVLKIYGPWRPPPKPPPKKPKARYSPGLARCAGGREGDRRQIN